MHVDRSSFLVLTATLFACAGAEPPRAGPAMLPQPTPPLVPVVSSAAPSSAASVAPPPDAEAPAPATDPVADAVAAYGDSLRHAHRCAEQTFDPKPRRAEQAPRHMSALSRQCAPLESFGFPSSCTEGAFGCEIVVNALTDAAAARVLACLRAKKGTAICADPGTGPRVGVVQGCAAQAFAATRPRDDAEPVCAAIASACSGRKDAVSPDACARFVSSIQMCDSVTAGLACLHDKCSVRACLDDFVGSYAF